MEQCALKCLYYVTCHFVCVCVRVCVPPEMFYSMGPAGMTSSVTSVRSGSELSDSEMESSTHSLSSITQPASLSQVQLLCVHKIISLLFFFSFICKICLNS